MERVTINKRIEISAPAAMLFDALTQPDQIICYYPVKRVESDMRVGGTVHYYGEHDGVSFTDFGTIDAFDRGRHFQYTYWSDNHGTERLPENHMTISYEIEADGSQSILIVAHRNAMSGEYSAVVDGIWDVVLNQLKIFVESKAFLASNLSPCAC